MVKRTRLSKKGSKARSTRMRKQAVYQIADGKTPNKYWVSVSSDYYVEDLKDRFLDWASSVKGITVKNKILKRFDTYEEAKRFADSITLQSKVNSIEANTISVEDRLSGQVYERSLGGHSVEDIKFTMEQEKKLGVPSSIRKGKIDSVMAEELYKLYNGQIPSYLNVVDRNKLRIMASPYEGAEGKWIDITPADVVNYYATDARDITSGARSLAGFGGDWRMIDNMAKESLEVFKVLNRKALDRESKKRGMELK